MTSGKKVFMRTFGCQMNERDSEAVLGLLRQAGYAGTDSVESADVILFNTCSVRDHAEARLFGLKGKLRELKEQKPGLLIGVLGCMAQEYGKRLFKKFPEADLVCGPGNLKELPDLLEVARCRKTPQLAVDKLEEEYGLEGIEYRKSRIRAHVTIMTGCDQRCTYCIVPYTRGSERSRSSKSILQELGDLERRGFCEVTLLGQNVNSYGKGLSENINFVDLLRMIQIRVPRIKRLRFMTSHPKDVNRSLFEAMRDLPMVCEHLHLPVQSGSNDILKKMKRLHTIEAYEEQVALYRALISGGSLTTDLIVGFPGETEKDFQKTLEFVQRIEFDGAYIFEYSPRPHTSAARLADDVPAKEKNRRLQALLKIQREIVRKKSEAFAGKTVEALFDDGYLQTKGQAVGRTRDYRRVVAKAPGPLPGETRMVRILSSANETLIGEMA